MVRWISPFVVLLSVAALAPAQENLNPYWLTPAAPPGYYWGYWHPYNHVAAVWDAQGRWLINKQKSRMLREKVQQEKLVTRRKELEHWHWEQTFIPRAKEEQRKLQREIEIRRAANDPPAPEIYSGGALNTLLRELISHHDQLQSNNSVPVKDEILAHIHVNVVSGVGNAGLLKGDKVPWPGLLLIRDDLAEDRTRIEQLVLKARATVLHHENPARETIELRERVDGLEKRMKTELRSSDGDSTWSPAQYIAAKRFLRELKDLLDLFDRPDAAECIQPLHGRTAADVVEYMREKGLHFTPATWGDERFYTSLYYVLRDELRNIRGVPTATPLP